MGSNLQPVVDSVYPYQNVLLIKANINQPTSPTNINIINHQPTNININHQPTDQRYWQNCRLRGVDYLRSSASDHLLHRASALAAEAWRCHSPRGARFCAGNCIKLLFKSFFFKMIVLKKCDGVLKKSFKDHLMIGHHSSAAAIVHHSSSEQPICF